MTVHKHVKSQHFLVRCYNMLSLLLSVPHGTLKVEINYLKQTADRQIRSLSPLRAHLPWKIESCLSLNLNSLLSCDNFDGLSSFLNLALKSLLLWLHYIAISCFSSDRTKCNLSCKLGFVLFLFNK